MVTAAATRKNITENDIAIEREGRDPGPGLPPCRSGTVALEQDQRHQQQHDDREQHQQEQRHWTSVSSPSSFPASIASRPSCQDSTVRPVGNHGRHRPTRRRRHPSPARRLVETVIVVSDSPDARHCERHAGPGRSTASGSKPMPLNGRMIFMLNRLAGGVNWQVPTLGASGTSGLRPFDNIGGSAWSMNGGRARPPTSSCSTARRTARAAATTSRRRSMPSRNSRFRPTPTTPSTDAPAAAW